MSKKRIIEIGVFTILIIFILFLLKKNRELNNTRFAKIQPELNFKETELVNLSHDLREIDSILGAQTDSIQSVGYDIVAKSSDFFRQQLNEAQILLKELQKDKYNFNPKLVIEKKSQLEIKIAEAKVSAQYTKELNILNRKLIQLADSCSSIDKIESLKQEIARLNSQIGNARYGYRIKHLEKQIKQQNESHNNTLARIKREHYEHISLIYKSIVNDTRLLNLKAKNTKDYLRQLSKAYADSARIAK